MAQMYLITPKSVLGCDSFWVQADNLKEAMDKALRKIRNEEWHSPNGWECCRLLGEFTDNNS